MEKRKNWQFLLILAVILLTGYNVLPTVFYYTKPLHKSIEQPQAETVAAEIEERLDALEKDSLDWVRSYCDLVQIKPLSVKLKDPQQISIQLAKIEDAQKLRYLISKAGALIPFAPAQLQPLPGETKEVLIARKIPTHVEKSAFQFAPKNSELYRSLILDRAEQIERCQSFFLPEILWEKSQIELKLRPGILPSQQEKIDALAKIAQIANETVRDLKINFHELAQTTGCLIVDLTNLLETQAQQIRDALKNEWNPAHADFQSLPVVSQQEFEKLLPEEQALCFIVAPANGSLYTIAKGFDQILQNYADQSEKLHPDLQKLALLLHQNGFFASRDASGRDLLFEKTDTFAGLLAATREKFRVQGTRKYASLELSTVEQRLLTLNQIETQIHEDLLKARDEYLTATSHIDPSKRFDAPSPKQSVFWSNLTLSARKWLRGDEKKVIRWGLDLSGGKTVQLELKDATGRTVKEPEAIKQGINELYTRVNKMGVSEVSIRQVGHQIVLDFPGSQALSAADLIQASSMYFHIVNETFSLHNPAHAEEVNRFLAQVWNEAIVTNRKDLQSINQIAFKQLTETAAGRALKEKGLNIVAPDDSSLSSDLDESVSKIALLRGNSPAEWNGQMHPLLIVFRNHVLEGSNLDNVRASYDSNQGNYLSFDVEGAAAKQQFHNWTSRFCKDNIANTSYEAPSQGRGWRMAVILNDTVISAPTLNAELGQSAMITGSFTQREVNQLASDLKAGSLTFTPHILSEKNVSPELGVQERFQGILATIIALLLVIGAMTAYYRFAGLVASVAVLFNLLIIWATLQNLNATLSLAGIAGIILNIGMAVDANVLVFERIKEEFAISGRIASAISAGYQKAYSAIIDSNVTTIIAALILLNFDAGPIKAFAITLIIGIVSSMFTALFMTRYYFAGWVQNPNHKTLKMANWVTAKKIDFLKLARPAFIAALAIIVAGGVQVFAQRNTLFGMDFTGGYSLNIELQGKKESFVPQVEKALLQAGASSQDIQVRQLDTPNHLRLLFSANMAQEGKPFKTQEPLSWISQALNEQNIALTAESARDLSSNWTAMSGQMSDSMRNNAAIGLAISLVCIFIYLAIRFEYPFAMAATLCLIHDVLITLGLIGLLHACGIPVQIDLNTVAAIMTIVGYSLNDTIIIFDRVREEMQLNDRLPLDRIVNQALNATLSRTAITSGTTLLVLIALVAFGGASIFSFSLVMTIGVFFGTLSSWFIAAPLLLYFHRKHTQLEMA